MRINTNVSSLTAQEASQNTSKTLTGSLEKLSTGLRINKASDDASGLAIADKSMAEQSNILDTVKAKLIQANTATTSSAGRKAISADISKLLTQFDNIAKSTNYNGTDLISASAKALDFQVGEDSTKAKITLDKVNSSASAYSLTGLKGLTYASGVTTAIGTASAATAQKTIDTAINTLNENRGKIGSTQNQVESAVRNLMTMSTNVKAAESIIRDVDYAAESANFNKQNIISQAGSYAISQANSVQQNVLRLLQ